MKTSPTYKTRSGLVWEDIDSDLREYYFAPSGEGPHAFNWKDKPHRLIYDLVELCQEARNNARRSDEAGQTVEQQDAEKN